MNIHTPQKLILDKIHLLSSFKQDIYHWLNGQSDLLDAGQLHSQIKQNTGFVREIVTETRCLKLMPTLPPSLTGGIIIRDCDPFSNIFGNSYGNVSNISEVMAMIDEAIVVLKSPKYLARLNNNLNNKR